MKTNAKTPVLAWAALVIWALVVAGSAVYAPRLGEVLKGGGGSAAGSESRRAGAVIAKELVGHKILTSLVVLTSDSLQVKDVRYKTAAAALVDGAKKLDGVQRVRTYWDEQEGRFLGKDGRTTFLVVEAAVSGETVMSRIVPELRALAKTAPPELKAYVTGEPAIGVDLKTEAVAAAAKSETFLIPAVLITLALIFGSLVAAALPLLLGLVSVATTIALLYFYGKVGVVDSMTPAVVSMLGMGVGVDYSLFMVTRFREELALGKDRREAVRVSMRTAGRAIIFSGATVVASVSSLYIVDNPIFRSLALAMVVVVVVSVLAAVTLLPTILLLLGSRVSALRVPFTGRGEGGGAAFWRRWALAVMRRPVFAAVAVAIPLLLLAYPALGMHTGWPNVSLLSPVADSRVGFTLLQDQFEVGAMEPVDVVIQVNQGTVADAQNLPRLYDLAQEIRKDPGVSAVVSHVSLVPEWDLAKYKQIYLEEPGKLADLPARLGEGSKGLTQSVDALKSMRAGLNTMAGKLPQLQGGIQQAGGGTAAVAAGLAQSRDGMLQIAQGIEQAAGGFQGIGTALATVDGLLQQAVIDLDAMQPQSKGDPKYAAVYRSVATAQGILSGGPGGTALSVSVKGAGASLQQSAAALKRMAAELGKAQAGLGQISGGLSTGSGGVGQVSTGVAEVVKGLDQLIPGLNQAAGQLGQAGTQAVSLDLKPAVARGDFGLRMVMEGGGQTAKESLPLLVNIDRGATTARFMVTPKGAPDSLEAKAMVTRLRTVILPKYAPDLGEILVGGTTAQLLDDNNQVSWALPRVVGLVLLITFGVLLILMRSVLLPLKAIVMNALSVLAAFGALSLVFDKGFGASLLGFKALGYVGSPTTVLLFAVLFGLSMDYEVFLLSRVKEAYDRTGRNEESVALGLQQTAGIITGAAAIMLVVFITFLLNGMITIKEFGLGLSVAVFLDASLIRLILVPAFMRLAGDWNWWAPAWLLRILPNLEIEH